MMMCYQLEGKNEVEGEKVRLEGGLEARGWMQFFNR